jgi:hypothetical protein
MKQSKDSRQQQGSHKEKDREDDRKNPGQKQDPHRGSRKDPDEEPVDESGSDVDPEKRIQIDDDPEQTKKKIPHMGKK